MNSNHDALLPIFHRSSSSARLSFYWTSIPLQVSSILGLIFSISRSFYVFIFCLQGLDRLFDWSGSTALCWVEALKGVRWGTLCRIGISSSRVRRRRRTMASTRRKGGKRGPRLPETVPTAPIRLRRMGIARHIVSQTRTPPIGPKVTGKHLFRFNVCLPYGRDLTAGRIWFCSRGIWIQLGDFLLKEDH